MTQVCEMSYETNPHVNSERRGLSLLPSVSFSLRHAVAGGQGGAWDAVSPNPETRQASSATPTLTTQGGMLACTAAPPSAVIVAPSPARSPSNIYNADSCAILHQPISPPRARTSRTPWARACRMLATFPFPFAACGRAYAHASLAGAFVSPADMSDKTSIMTNS